MKTTKPISTISYNSLGFLNGTLKRLVESGILSFWAFIQHEPEEDETKPHFHVYMKPAKAVDTLWLQKEFTEVCADPLPRKCLPIDPSKFADWYWYGLHDATYLAGKGQSRKVHYDPSQVVSSDPDYLFEIVRLNPCPESEMVKALRLMRQGLTAFEIAMAMKVPVAKVNAFVSGLYAMARMRADDITYREQRAGHEQALEAQTEEEKKQ